MPLTPATAALSWMKARIGAIPVPAATMTTGFLGSEGRRNLEEAVPRTEQRRRDPGGRFERYELATPANDPRPDRAGDPSRTS